MRIWIIFICKTANKTLPKRTKQKKIWRTRPRFQSHQSRGWEDLKIRIISRIKKILRPLTGSLQLKFLREVKQMLLQSMRKFQTEKEILSQRMSFKLKKSNLALINQDLSRASLAPNQTIKLRSKLKYKMKTVWFLSKKFLMLTQMSLTTANLFAEKF